MAGRRNVDRDARRITRRQVLSFGAAGLSLPSLLTLRARAAATEAGGRFGRAKSCIVLFAWGGMSHLDTWDLKPEADAGIRGEFRPTRTAVPGIRISEHLQHLAREMGRIAVVRSVHHKASDHREAAYWNLTGHQPRRLGAPAIPPSRVDWPCIGSMVSRQLGGRRHASQKAVGMPSAVSLPYPCADRGLLNGQYGGFLGGAHDPVFLRPEGGTAYPGVSPRAGIISLDLPDGLTRDRVVARRRLLGAVEASQPAFDATSDVARFHEQAMDLLLNASARRAFDLDDEPAALRAAYGDHICGRSVLLARRLTEAGVPLVTVCCGAGDLNGGSGAHWDTHGDNFNRLERDLLPPLDRASAALVRDLAQRGRLDETLVVWLTEFGRTPKINGGAGRDHYPGCYSVAFAGGGIAGGQVYGASDRSGIAPADLPCGPADLHATIFCALGIDPQTILHDLDGRPVPLTDGQALPLFG